MLKKVPSFVLVSLKTSTYGKEYASVFRSLRPRRETFLNILLGMRLRFGGGRSLSYSSSRLAALSDFAEAAGSSPRRLKKERWN